MKARIVTIGDEILIGQIVDTNSAWLAAELNNRGIAVECILSIADTREAIHQQLNDAVGQVDLVLMTGGLGPTKDDVTKGALKEWFGGDWHVDERVMARVERHFKERGVPMPEVNKEQAWVPTSCEVLFNAHGSAPGMWFQKEGTVFISMPGVPYEMKAIFTEEAVPRIQDTFKPDVILHRTIHTQGIGESSVMEIIASWEASLASVGLKLAYLPSPGAVRLRISGSSQDESALKEKMEQKVEALLPLIEEYVFGFDGAKLEEEVGALLKEQGWSLSTAESCTGGYISHLITSVPGSSAYFKGATVAYSNDVKVKQLGVREEDIIAHGAVSEQVALQMAIGAQQTHGSDFAIATTGIAGPDGGSDEKPVGTVWIAIAGPSRVYAHCFQMGKHRQRNIHKSTLQGLQGLRKEILEELRISEPKNVL